MRLFLDRVCSFIIRRDGSFALRTADAYGSSCFERARTLYHDVDEVMRLLDKFIP